MHLIMVLLVSGYCLKFLISDLTIITFIWIKYKSSLILKYPTNFALE